MPAFQFVKSSYSNSSGECVEVAINLPDAIAVRDSKDTGGPILHFTPAEWHIFHHAIRRGEFDG